MKILITGVAGFIGSNLAIRLIKKGRHVIGIDNLSHGYERNIESILNNKNFQFILGDIANPMILNDIHVDIIVHLASQKIPRYTNSLRTLDENYLMLRNIVQKCLFEKAKLVFASTSDVYGKNKNIPFHEDSDLLMGSPKIKRWAYAMSKLYGEHYILANSDQFGLKFTIVRFFGSYGPHQNLTWWGGPQSVFITSAFKNEPIEIHGQGEQTRTFTYIEDTITALLHCLFDEKSNGEIFNIASNPEEEISIINLGKLIWRLVRGEKESPRFKFIPYETFGRYEDVLRRVPDISKIKKYFNFEPSFKLESGLLRTIEWQKKFLNEDI